MLLLDYVHQFHQALDDEISATRKEGGLFLSSENGTNHWSKMLPLWVTVRNCIERKGSQLLIENGATDDWMGD